MSTISAVLLFGMPGGWEMFIIIFVVLLLFGAKKIPELARGLGRGIREFKDATKEIKDEIDEESKSIKKSVND
ncbi:Sec-independent protein translocase subunit TatA/TatB [Chondrinema litorale]|uniref:Sec-independent protein translocase subunit TatA/TatB n=1 Tax=Chondrinema litorale TaxID=2994555 RepID=UPI0025432D56|nr:twin-arginine translocase TatA/TatE family subunit [Chondrinema litorale]UZR92901.1 twin-arginine translocase TatA/TatE family subunit [Chondrinema litorale]